MKNILLSIDLNLSIEDLVKLIEGSLNREEIIEFIKLLDKETKDWSITKELNVYFISEHQRFIDQLEK